MSLIEQAAKRLEELRRAGVEAPDNTRDHVGSARTPAIQGAKGLASILGNSATPVDTSSKSMPPAIDRPNVLTLDFVKLAESGFVTPDTPRSRVAEEFRRHRTRSFAEEYCSRRPLFRKRKRGFDGGRILEIDGRLNGRFPVATTRPEI